MTPKEHRPLNALCQKIQHEKDPQKFDAYVRELGDLLDEKEKAIRQSWKNDPFVTKLRAKAS